MTRALKASREELGQAAARRRAAGLIPGCDEKNRLRVARISDFIREGQRL